MAGSLWTRFRKTQSDEDTSDHDISEKKPVQAIIPVVDVSPGGLSFEEGASINSFAALLPGSVNVLNRHCWRARPSSRRHLMYPSRRRNHHWYRHFLDAFLNSERSRLDRGITHAMGARLSSLVLWLVYLARVWDHVSPEWWGKGLLGGGLSETEIPCYGGVCCECYIARISVGWVYCKCRLGVCDCF